MYFKSFSEAELDRKKEMEAADNIYGKYTAKTYSFDSEFRAKLNSLK